MANANRCDRCGKFYVDGDFGEERPRYRVFDFSKSCYYANMDTDLCPDCSKKLHEWMENKPEPNVHRIYLDIHRPDPCPRCSFTCEPKKKRWWEK